MLLPPRLRRGDLIGIVAPAGPVTDASRIEKAVRYFERQGYRVAVGAHAGRVHGYLAGTDGERLEDLHAMFRDPRVRALVALRGGYGTTRLLPLLDFRLIRRNPKIVCGYSDLTALQLALWHACRLVTFHGPMAGPDFAGPLDPVTEERFWTMVTAPAVPCRLATVAAAPASARRRTTGRLLGGNLSLLVSLLGTPFQPSLSGAVLFIEEVGEEPYRIDRMLTQLRNAGVMDRLRAILTGRFEDCAVKDPRRPSFSTGEVLAGHAGALLHLAALPFGHVSRKVTIPIGVPVAVDGDAGTVDLLAPAVV